MCVTRWVDGSNPDAWLELCLAQLVNTAVATEILTPKKRNAMLTAFASHNRSRDLFTFPLMSDHTFNDTHDDLPVVDVLWRPSKSPPCAESLCGLASNSAGSNRSSVTLKLGIASSASAAIAVAMDSGIGTSIAS